MSKGRFISIDGTDASGKTVQTDLLVNRLRSDVKNVTSVSFPVYESTTGMIVGANLGKRECIVGLVQKMFPGIDQKVIEIMQSHPIVKSPFDEGAVNLDPKVASMYFCADRLYNVKGIIDGVSFGDYVVTNRYVEANKGHQGGKIDDPQKRMKFYSWLDDLEYGVVNLPRPDLSFLLHMPTEVAVKLRQGRIGEADEHEKDLEHLREAENAYLQLAENSSMKIIRCAPGGNLRTREDIHEEIYWHVKNS